jgi:hypothetical protein
VIIAAALPLAVGPAANPLLRMIRIRLKDSLTVMTMAVIHQGDSGSEWNPFILPGSTVVPTQKLTYGNGRVLTYDE